MNGDWFSELRAHAVTAVGVAFGLTKTHGRGLSPCPACGAGMRHPRRGDKRGAVGVRSDELGWRCHECNASGDAVTLAALVATGSANPNVQRWSEVRAACAQRGLCSGDSRREPLTPRVAALRTESFGGSPPRRPPSAEVAALWAACHPASGDRPASAWLRERALNPADVEAFDLARVLPVSIRAPSWASFRGRPWPETTHRLLVPLFDASGTMRSIHARALVPATPADKAASPAGAEIRGLVMADALGQRLLAGLQLGDGRPAAELVRKAGVWIAEGVPDFLTLASAWGDADEAAPAVFGVIAGSWSSEIAARMPDGCTVVIATHADDAGGRYAVRIADTLGERVSLRRWYADGRAA